VGHRHRNIDLAAAQRRGVTVCNTAGVNAGAVAEHAIALMLAVARRIPKLDREMRAGAWPREMLTQLLGKTLGVFGTGAIGMRVIALGRALGMQALAWSARGDVARIAAAGARARPGTDPARSGRGHAASAPCARHARLPGPARVVLDETIGHPDQHRARRWSSATPCSSARRGQHQRRARRVPQRAARPGIRSCPSQRRASPHNAGQTPEVVRDGLLRAVENIENFLHGRPTGVVASPRA
jgi:lactate dehydrogenase-like 2-hydroxyacid dehydrogenase